MRAILPGRPPPKLQAITTALWDGLRVIAYISGNAVNVLEGPRKVLQTIYIDDDAALEAITFEETSGRIAVCGTQRIYVYEPYGREEGVLKWSQLCTLINEPEFAISTLSWGSVEELLVGGVRLSLWYIPETEEPTAIWTQEIANSVQFASMSHEADIIASAGYRDRLVKIWRRLSYEMDSTRFDASYLAHPTAVTSIRWRKPWHAEQSLENLLYTFCADNHIRVWSHSDLHAVSIMQLVTEIDMSASIQPRRLSVGSVTKRRYGFIVDSRDFSRATENAVQQSAGTGTDHALEHLIEIANRSPEICVVLDGLGHMSTWGLENAGLKGKQPVTVFHVAHVDGLEIDLRKSNNLSEDYVQFCTFSGGLTESSMSILVHHFDGRIDWFDAQIAELFDTSSRQQRVEFKASWTGHDAAITKLIRGSGQGKIVSRADNNEAIIWMQNGEGFDPILQRQSILQEDNDILHSCLVSNDRFLLNQCRNGLSLWDLTQPRAEKVGFLEWEYRNMPQGLFRIASPAASAAAAAVVYVASMDTSLTGTVYELHPPSIEVGVRGNSNGYRPPLQKFCDFLLQLPSKPVAIIQIEAPPAQAAVPSYLDMSFEYSAIAYSAAGELFKVGASVNLETKDVNWVVSPAVETGITNPALVKPNAHGQVALANDCCTTLSIWDAKGAQLEHMQTFTEGEAIDRLAWTSSNHESVLAVGFAFRVVVLMQCRYSSEADRPAWILIHEIRVRDFATHSIADLCWLGYGGLLFGAGSQLFIWDNSDSISQTTNTIESKSACPTMLQRLQAANGPLAVFHPTFLKQCLLSGGVEPVRRILRELNKQLKFLSPTEDLSSDLGMPLEEIFTQNSSRADRASVSHLNGLTGEDSSDLLTDDTARTLAENLSKVALWQLSRNDTSSLISFIQAVTHLETHQSSMDLNALHYMHLCTQEASSDRGSTQHTPWQAVAFATLSTTQDLLLSLTDSTSVSKVTWSQVRSLGPALYLASLPTLTGLIESIARNEYILSSDRNPVDCSLFYLALRKKSVLQGLWRMTSGNREKESTIKLLARNFEDPGPEGERWRKTALKNAYALLSKRRFAYAAAWFLLGGRLTDAARVCVTEMGDVTLGLAVARCHAGDVHEGNQVLKELVEGRVLTEAAETGNRFMAAWAYSQLGRTDKAIQVLVRPVYMVVNEARSEPVVPTLLARSYRHNMPILLMLFQRLREKLVQDTRSGKAKGLRPITRREEWEFVMRCVRNYIRMGCHWLALGLVRDWEFLSDDAWGSATHTAIPDVGGKHVDSESQEKTDDEEAGETRAEQKPAARPPPTQFQEPSANSLLDSFGF